MKMQNIDGVIICCGATIQGIGVSRESAYKNFERNCRDRNIMKIPAPSECEFFKATQVLVE